MAQDLAYEILSEFPGISYSPEPPLAFSIIVPSRRLAPIERWGYREENFSGINLFVVDQNGENFTPQTYQTKERNIQRLPISHALVKSIEREMDDPEKREKLKELLRSLYRSN